MGDNLTALEFGPNDILADIYCGGFFTCARFMKGLNKCWGSNGKGELGQGLTIPNYSTAPEEKPKDLDYINLGPRANTTMLALSLYSSCSLLDDHRVICWGENNSGQLGTENSDDVGKSSYDMGIYLEPVLFFYDANVFCELTADNYLLELWINGKNYTSQISADLYSWESPKTLNFYINPRRFKQILSIKAAEQDEIGSKDVSGVIVSCSSTLVPEWTFQSSPNSKWTAFSSNSQTFADLWYFTDPVDGETNAIQSLSPFSLVGSNLPNEYKLWSSNMTAKYAGLKKRIDIPYSDDGVIPVLGMYLNWNDANRYCNDRYGTNLATIRSKSNNLFISSLKRNMWIGLNDIKSERLTSKEGWKWSSLYNKYTKEQQTFWAVGEPNNKSDNEDCVLSIPGTGWADRNCEEKYEFFCDSTF